MNSISANAVDCINELDGECSDSQNVGYVAAAGTVTNAVQLRSATGTFTADDTFYFNSTSQSFFGKSIVTLLPRTAAATTTQFTAIPSWMKRLTIHFNSISTSSTSGPVIRFGGPTGTFTSTNLAGATWGSANTSGQYAWDGAAIFITNSPTTWVSSLSIQGKCVVEKIGEIAGESYYDITLHAAQETANNFAFGAGRYKIASYISQVQIVPNNYPTSVIDAGAWAVFCE